MGKPTPELIEQIALVKELAIAFDEEKDRKSCVNAAKSIRAVLFALEIANKRTDRANKRVQTLEWKPVTDEFPVDGFRMLAYCPPYGAGSAHKENGQWILHFCLNRDAVPTHWMPLPKALTEKSDEN